MAEGILGRRNSTCKMVEIPERLRWGPVAVEWDVWGPAGGEPVEQGLQHCAASDMY